MEPARLALAAVSLAIWLAGLIVVAAPAAGQSVAELAKKEGKVVWYSSLGLDLAQKVCNTFSQRHPGVTCELTRSGSERIFQRIMQELKANLAIADVVHTSDAAHFVDFKTQGMLMAYEPAGMKSIRADFKDPDGVYYTLRGTPYVMAYNSRLVPKDQAPRKWQDLLDPKWRGKVAHGHPGYSGIVTTGMLGILSKYGWDYYAALAKNQPIIGQSAEDPPVKVAGGEGPIGVSGEYNLFRAKKKGNPIEIVFPEDVVPFVNSPVAILKRAPHPNAAKLFMDFLFGKEAQQLMADDGLYVPNEAVTYPPGKTPLKDLKSVVPDPMEILKRNEEIKAKFRELFGV
ncbi:MAG: extracellular solute-binding protein [candidate division NC10 bacterium]|nr:extracellular solute-binding protein [candidate division NC10 bacterium]